MILKENMPSHRYLRCAEANNFIGKEVYGRNPVDWGDDRYWEKGTLVAFEPTNYKTTSRDTRGKWTVHVGGFGRIFDWCSVETANESNGDVVRPDMWPHEIETMKRKSDADLNDLFTHKNAWR